MNNKLILLVGGALIIVFGVGGVLIASSIPRSESFSNETANQVDNMGQTKTSDTVDEQSTSGTVKKFNVTGKNFSYSPATLAVNKGDTVQIDFDSTNGTHDFVIDELKVASKIVANGGSDTIEFIASEAGTFEYYCSVGNHRSMGMKGTLTVK